MVTKVPGLTHCWKGRVGNARLPSTFGNHGPFLSDHFHNSRVVLHILCNALLEMTLTSPAMPGNSTKVFLWWKTSSLSSWCAQLIYTVVLNHTQVTL